MYINSGFFAEENGYNTLERQIEKEFIKMSLSKIFFWGVNTKEVLIV